MALEEVGRIKSFFSEAGMNAVYLEHQAAITSEDAARTRGFELRQGIKSILLTNGKDEWVVVNVPANRKIDSKKVAECLGWSKNRVRMASSDEVMQKTGCEIGAVPPFGHRESIPILVDTGVYDNEISTFNIGLRTHSVKIETDLMKKLFSKIGATEGIFTR